MVGFLVMLREGGLTEGVEMGILLHGEVDGVGDMLRLGMRRLHRRRDV